MERWFYTGSHMEDGVTPISVCAYNEPQVQEFIRNGWKPVDDLKGNTEKKAKGKKR